MPIIPIIKNYTPPPRTIENMDKYQATVRTILDDVKNKGDKAIQEYTQKFDNAKPKNIRVTEKEIKDAYTQADKKLISCLKKAISNIEKYQLALIQKDITIKRDGITLRSLKRPIESIGAYVPAGTALYISTAYMLGIPAKIANCKKRIICTPPRKDSTIAPEILVTCDMAGFNEIYKIGGAQAIAAMAYGTKTVTKADKIFGPGNIFVNTAKNILKDTVSIDMFAGPSEIMIIADTSSNPRFIASDMLAEAEHDTLSTAILTTDSKKIASAVQKQITIQAKALERKDIAKKALSDNGKIILCKTIDECIELANDFAPEHLEIMTQDNESVLKKITTAGSVFLGDYSSAVTGDYASGTNHVLPTMGFAKSTSGLSVNDFMRSMEVTETTKQSIRKIGKTIRCLSETESLTGHAKAIELRMEELQ